jgi:hypothetical protein
VAGVCFFTTCLILDFLIGPRFCSEATPQMPKLSLLVMLDGEASDSESKPIRFRLTISFQFLLVDEFELEYVLPHLSTGVNP